MALLRWVSSRKRILFGRGGSATGYSLYSPLLTPWGKSPIGVYGLPLDFWEYFYLYRNFRGE